MDLRSPKTTSGCETTRGGKCGILPNRFVLAPSPDCSGTPPRTQIPSRLQRRSYESRDRLRKWAFRLFVCPVRKNGGSRDFAPIRGKLSRRYLRLGASARITPAGRTRITCRRSSGLADRSLKPWGNSAWAWPLNAVRPNFPLSGRDRSRPREGQVGTFPGESRVGVLEPAGFGTPPFAIPIICKNQPAIPVDDKRPAHRLLGRGLRRRFPVGVPVEQAG